MNELIPIEDMNYLAQLSQGKINMILSGMTALMNDTEDKTEKIEKQNWFQRMVKTVTGKNRATREEIKQNHDKLNAYMSQAIAELYNRNCIDSQVMISLGTQLNELYAEHLQLKQMLGAFVVKLNEKIDSVDNFHMLNTEIEQGVYSDNEKIVAICKVMSQFDNRIMEEPRKLDILRRSMEKQEIITGDEVLLTDYLMDIMNISVDEIGKIYLELSTIRNDFFANLILGIIEDYHFLPDIQRKMMKKDKLIENLIQREGLDGAITLSINEIYDNFLNSKIKIKKELELIKKNEIQKKNQSNSNDYEVKEAEQLFLDCKFDEAFELFEKLAENGNGRAMYFLGEFYAQPYGKIEKNKEKGKEWRIKGKKAGDILSTLNIGRLLSKNLEERNSIFLKSFEKVLKLSKDKDVFAQHELAEMYLYGYGIKKNKEEGIKLLKKSAKLGYWRAMIDLGNIYYNQEKYEEAIEWFRRSFVKGYDLGGYNLAMCYYHGNGVKKDYKTAIRLLEEVYDLKDSASGLSANCLGNIYCFRKNNMIPFFKDYKIAVEWYKKGIERGYNRAYYNLAKCYYNGNGVEKDKNKAYELYRKAAELGIEEARSIINNWY